jgi:hypothetical protein
MYGPDSVKLQILAASATDTVDSIAQCGGFVECVSVTRSASNVDITLATLATSGALVAQTILSEDAIAANKVFYPRRLIDDTAGDAIAANYARVFVAPGDVLRLTVDAIAAGNPDVNVVVVISQH